MFATFSTPQISTVWIGYTCDVVLLIGLILQIATAQVVLTPPIGILLRLTLLVWLLLLKMAGEVALGNIGQFEVRMAHNECKMRSRTAAAATYECN